MLDACAAGYRLTETKHKWRICYRDKTMLLPLGKHGHRRNPEIEIGHIRKMTRLFAIQPCAQEQLPQLR